MNIMNVPGFTAEASLYKTNQRYQLLASWAGVTKEYVGLAQFLSLPDGQPDGQSCLVRVRCLPDPDSPTGCSKIRTELDCTETNLGSCQCPPPPTTCGPCNRINPTTLEFTQTCTTGGGSTFTRPCTNCSPETRISLPFPVSDRCIRFCCSAALPSSCSVTVRTC